MSDGDDASAGVSEALQRLGNVLDAANELTKELMHDRNLQRLIESFRLMPLEDRDIIIGAVEREVQARRLSRATEDATGQSMYANPHARLYLRAHEKAVPRMPLERDELMLAMLAAMRVTPILLVPEIHGEFIEGTQAALEHVDPATLDVVAGLLRETLALVEERQKAASQPAAPQARAV
jgi:hypothetical protein